MLDGTDSDNLCQFVGGGPLDGASVEWGELVYRSQTASVCSVGHLAHVYVRTFDQPSGRWSLRYLGTEEQAAT